PFALTKCNGRDAPWASLVACGLVYSFVALFFQNVEELAAADLTLYAVMVTMELLSFLFLRMREPQLARPFKVAAGWACGTPLCALPVVCLAPAAYYHVGEFGFRNVIVKPLIALAVVPLLFPLVRWRQRTGGQQIRGDHG